VLLQTYALNELFQDCVGIENLPWLATGSEVLAIV
jgi:hypothetical protein